MLSYRAMKFITLNMLFYVWSVMGTLQSSNVCVEYVPCYSNKYVYVYVSEIMSMIHATHPFEYSLLISDSFVIPLQ